MTTHQATSDEKHGNRDVLEVFEAPLAAPAAKVLQENIGRTVDENESALDELGGRGPSAADRPRFNIPCLYHVTRRQYSTAIHQNSTGFRLQL